MQLRIASAVHAAPAPLTHIFPPCGWKENPLKGDLENISLTPRIRTPKRTSSASNKKRKQTRNRFLLRRRLHKTLPQGYPVRRSERRGFGEGLGSDRFAASTLTLTLDEAARMRPQKLVPPKFNAELCLCRLEVGGPRVAGTKGPLP